MVAILGLLSFFLLLGPGLAFNKLESSTSRPIRFFVHFFLALWIKPFATRRHPLRGRATASSASGAATANATASMGRMNATARRPPVRTSSTSAT
ncbi:hypothetical protein BV898_19479 [Hypsibius exemplaris]|uniref:Secreted protein n=1 Tax=Hypsibius exemplaris TaxID=2072580 RepID=A0A9X6NL09_HYPEX|nr:hypothetical protein BV898_19479 [Hypsibius exemplaris]